MGSSSKTQSPLNFLLSGPRKFTKSIFGIGPDPVSSDTKGYANHSIMDKLLQRGCCTFATRILGNEFWTPEFRTQLSVGSDVLLLLFPAKRRPEKLTLKKFASKKFSSLKETGQKIHIALLQGNWPDIVTDMI